jgi:hypothetical protein
MTVNLLALGDTGVVAIYTGEDDAPFSAPLNHLANGRLKFHSSLKYPKIVQERTVTVTLPARVSPDNGGREYRQSYNLFAHGRPGIPWVLASLRLAGRNVAAVGSVPVQKVVDTSTGDDHMTNTPMARLVSIGANGTYVTAFEYAQSSRIYLRYPAISIPITVWVTDESF